VAVWRVYLCWAAMVSSRAARLLASFFGEGFCLVALILLNSSTNPSGSASGAPRISRGAAMLFDPAARRCFWQSVRRPPLCCRVAELRLS